MFRSMQSQGSSDDGPVVDIASLIDVVFLLLIFFLVTSSFARESVLPITPAKASTATSSERVRLRVSITAEGAVYEDGDRLELGELARRVVERRERSGLRSVVVIPDQEAPSGRLVEVMDAVRGAGIADIAVVAEKVAR